MGKKSIIFRPMILNLIFISFALLISTYETHAIRFDNNQSIEKSGTDKTQTHKVSDQELAYGFLASQETLYGPLGMLYRELAELRQTEEDLPFTLSYIMHNPDGSIQRIVLRKMSELGLFIDRVKKRRNHFADLIRNRGFRPLVSSYQVTADDRCSDKWFKSGLIKVLQSDFQLEFTQGGKSFKAAVVGKSIAVIFSGGLLPPLTGEIDRQGKFELIDKQSVCKFRLSPNSLL